MNNLDKIFELTYGCKIEDASEELCSRIRNNLYLMMKKYSSNITTPSYTNEERDTYMIKYLLNYAKLTKMFFVDYIRESKYDINRDLKICLMASGPGTELLALVSALSKLGFKNKVEFYCLDNEDGWSKQLDAINNYINLFKYEYEYTTKFIKCNLTNNCYCSVQEIEFGFENCDRWCECEASVFGNCDFFFLNNAISYFENELHVIKDKISKIKSGARFIIMDSAYVKIINILSKILSDSMLNTIGEFNEYYVDSTKDGNFIPTNIAQETNLVNVKFGKETSIYNVLSTNVQVDISESMSKKIFTKEDGTWPMKNRKWLYLVFEKEPEITF